MPSKYSQESDLALNSWLQRENSIPESCSLDQLRSQGIAFPDASNRLQTQVAAANKSLEELRARVTSNLSRVKKAGGSAAVGDGGGSALHQKALLALQSRLDGLSLRISVVGSACLRLARSALVLKSQAEAVSKLQLALQDILSGPVAKAQVTSNDVLSHLTEALDASLSYAATDPTADGAVGTAVSSSAPTLVMALAERADLKEQATAVSAQAREILGQAEAILAKAGRLQVRSLDQNNNNANKGRCI